MTTKSTYITNNQILKVGFVQFSSIFGDVKNNVETSLRLIEKEKSADLLVLPELSNTGYSFHSKFELENLAESIETSTTINSWKNIAEEMNTSLIASLTEKKGINSLFQL